MNARKLALTSTAIVALSGVSASGALAATSTADVSADIIAAAEVSIATAPDFGSLSGQSGQITLSSSGDSVGTTGGDFSTAGGSPASGVVNITQSSGTVTITASLADLDDGGGNTLHASSLTVTGQNGTTFSVTSAGTAPATINTSTAGVNISGTNTTTTATLGVGAGVATSSSVPAGTYTGTLTFNVTNQ